METSFLLPDTADPASAPFWEGTAAGELRVQACADCGLWRMPPRPMCPACLSLDAVWHVTSGRGQLWSYVRPHPPLLPAYAAVAPYNVIVVELAEDPRIRFVGNLVADPSAELNSVPEDRLAIGMSVSVAFGPAQDGVVLPRWVPT